MEMVAAIMKIKDKDKVIEWLDGLPRKYAVEEVQKLLKVINRDDFLFWTETLGIKILK